jgi:hypothetical protein
MTSVKIAVYRMTGEERIIDKMLIYKMTLKMLVHKMSSDKMPVDKMAYSPLFFIIKVRCGSLQTFSWSSHLSGEGTIIFN